MILCGASATSRTVASVDHAPGCPRCRPGTGRRRSGSRAAGAAGCSPRPGDRSGRTRSGSCPGWRPPASAAVAPTAEPSPVAVRAELDPLAGPGHHLQRDHVVGGLAVAQSARTAGVVADHAADGAPVVGGRVGPEPQPVRGGRRPAAPPAPRRAATRAVRASGSMREDRVQVPGDVDDQTRPDRVPGARRARSPGGHRQPDCPSGVQHGHQLVDRAGPGHGLRGDPVERGVGGVEGAGQPAGVEHIAQVPPASARADSSASSGVTGARVGMVEARLVGRGVRGQRSPSAATTAENTRPTAAYSSSDITSTKLRRTVSTCVGAAARIRSMPSVGQLGPDAASVRRAARSAGPGRPSPSG